MKIEGNNGNFVSKGRGGVNARLKWPHAYKKISHWIRSQHSTRGRKTCQRWGWGGSYSMRPRTQVEDGGKGRHKRGDLLVTWRLHSGRTTDENHPGPGHLSLASSISVTWPIPISFPLVSCSIHLLFWLRKCFSLPPGCPFFGLALKESAAKSRCMFLPLLSRNTFPGPQAAICLRFLVYHVHVCLVLMLPSSVVRSTTFSLAPDAIFLSLVPNLTACFFSLSRGSARQT
jgi:hypothetical protein